MRKNRAKFKVRLYHPEYIIIEDIGTDHKSVTNDAENVVADLIKLLDGRKLYYIDSMGSIDHILIENGKFKGFKFGGPDD